MKTVMSIVGARPQFIKSAPVSRALKADGMREVLVHTGQHFDKAMSDIFFDELGLVAPEHHLSVAGGGHGEMTGRMLIALEPLVKEINPDYVVVYGDTNSTLAGALCAAKLHYPVAHVEAGLRSYNREMPEEQNRVLTDHLADILFTPTDIASQNLRGEGVADELIEQVGDVMYDASILFRESLTDRKAVLAKHCVQSKQYVLATVHRAENTDQVDRLAEILRELNRLTADLPVILPLHPRTRASIDRHRLDTGNIRCIEPIGYMAMVALQSEAAVIATDSGGVQKEAHFHGVPCVTLRQETEWTELVELGWNTLAPPLHSDIAYEIRESIGRLGRAGSPYGDGDAAVKISNRLRSKRGA